MSAVNDAQAHAHAARVFGPGAVVSDRATQGDASVRYFVAPGDFLSANPDDRLPFWHQGTGPTWEAAFESYNDTIVREGLAPLAAALARYRFTSHDEHRLYPLMEQVLRDAGFDFVREHRLDEKSRLDFWFPALRVALEVKVKGAPHRVLSQVARYATHPSIGAVLLATTVAKLAVVPEILESKPARAVRLAGAFG